MEERHVAIEHMKAHPVYGGDGIGIARRSGGLISKCSQDFMVGSWREFAPRVEKFSRIIATEARLRQRRDSLRQPELWWRGHSGV
jgi:hypothetical protein